MKKIFKTNLISEVASSDKLEKAFAVVCKKRKKEGDHSDIWFLRRRWKEEKRRIIKELLIGKYQMEPVHCYKVKDGNYITRWSSRDSVVLKAIGEVLYEHAVAHNKAYHIRGKGGLKKGVKDLIANIKGYKYVIKSDIENFYGSMDHKILLKKCKEVIKDKKIQSLIYQCMNRLEIRYGEYNLIEKGISRGCPISNILGAIVLESLDELNYRDTYYVRYMDDWVYLTKTRGMLRKIVKKMHVMVRKLKFRVAVDKTYIGKISRGFEYLGYRFTGSGIQGLAPKTMTKFKERVTTLYEQGASAHRIGCYVRRWLGWVTL